jgi:hypothetical protein
MSLTTHSQFYFGYEVDESNRSLDFSEGAAELQATVEIGSYSLTEFADAVEDALNEAGALTYTVSINRTTRILTVAAGSSFELLVSSGSRAASSVYALMGFTGSDRTGDDSYAGDAAAGSAYNTQFILQSYVPPEHFIQAASAVVNKSASGKVEVIKFGEEQFIEADFKFITSRSMPTGGMIRNSASGLTNFLTFMEFLITKAPLEFMPDENTPSTFYKVILESVPSFSDGTGFRLKELVDRGLPGFYETGVMKFRVVD